MNCVLMLGCSSWPVFTGQDTNRFSASGVINPDGIFSEPPCPTSVSMKSAGRFVLTISFPDAVRTSWLPSARWGICGRIVWSCSSTQADICVDEQLVPFRGRCNFKQYIPTKPAKYGLKIWAVCDVETSYAWRLQVYTGKAGDRAEVNQGMRVALELTEGLQGNVVTCDNFFTSFALAEELLRRKLALVGTIRKNKPELPPRLLQTRGTAVFSSAFAFTLTHTLVSYVPRRGKNVLLMSTKHRTPDVSEEGKRKPVIIQDYNRCKGGVDNLDKVVGTYSCRRKTNRWPVALFHNLLDVSLYNSYVLWTAIDPSWKQQKDYKRRLYVEEVGEALVNPHILKRGRLPRSSGAADIVTSAQSGQSAAAGPALIPKSKGRRPCDFCDEKRRRVVGTCCKCGKSTCKDHILFICSLCVN
uniref:PiggyBac transposable element-derived protein domain-containing protein n=1 Tax=Oreochromis aureus TaxID=47969 RepID=A0AAZ1Y4A3_OREAU